MPDPCQFASEAEFVGACIPERREEYPDESPEQSQAVCFSMWRERECNKALLKAADVLVPNEDRQATFVASTDAPDRDGDIVVQSWDFGDFLKNPVLFFGHQSRDLPIGIVDRIYTEARPSVSGSRRTISRTSGVPEKVDEFADKVWKMIRQKFLRGASIGFLPIEEPRPRRDDSGRQIGWIYPRNRLLELSVTPLPSNPEATLLDTATKGFHCTDRDLDRLFSAKSVSAGRSRMKNRAWLDFERLRVRR